MSEATLKPLRVAIIGGGIAGLCMALALQQRIEEGADIEYTVYEQSRKFGEIGAGGAYLTTDSASLGPLTRRLNSLHWPEQPASHEGNGPRRRP